MADILEIQGITKKFGGLTAVDNVDLTLKAGELGCIIGPNGCGKTTLLRSISTVFQTRGRRLLLAAPTGRAAHRLAEVTRRKASTIHRLLGYNFTDNGFIQNRDNPLDADAVIVDEASMVDTALMFSLLNALPLSARLILVGDVFQLPSVVPKYSCRLAQQIPLLHLSR